MSQTLLVASHNQAKLEELQRILDAELHGAPVRLLGLSDVPAHPQPAETGLTFADNALIKARAGVVASGLPTVADDSGLAVDALNGMPGVFSARWSGRHGDDQANLRLLLAQLSDVEDDLRTAAFVCAAALVLPDGREFTAGGLMRGWLVREPRGTGGFGYDPIFVVDGEDRTNAELSPAEKDAISHRGKAFRALAQIVASKLPG
jgi:XTP/dITP diphosphohydrolase